MITSQTKHTLLMHDLANKNRLLTEKLQVINLDSFVMEIEYVKSYVSIHIEKLKKTCLYVFYSISSRYINKRHIYK